MRNIIHQNLIRPIKPTDYTYIYRDYADKNHQIDPLLNTVALRKVINCVG